nr:M13 family metallopeptidase N-terminal domain-containing protein [Spiroplasma clarkii]
MDSDFKDSNLRAVTINSMGLGMSDKDFYDPTHPRHIEIKTAYEKYIIELANYSKIKFKTNDLFKLIYDFEETLTKGMLRQEELRDVERIYNVYTIADLQKMCPFIDWQKYLATLGYDKAKKIIVSEPKFFEDLSQMLDKISLDDIKDLIYFDIIDGYTGMLTAEMEQIAFNYGSVFNGVTEMKPVKERAVSFTNGLVGELVGQEYVKEHFSESSKKDVLKIVNDLIKVYEKRILNLDWMTSATKTKAIEKLKTFAIKIGYPDKFEDYSKLQLDHMLKVGLYLKIS